jgi:hypothetical protein
VSGDETWIHQLEPRDITRIHEVASYELPMQKSKTASSAGKVMAAVFWDMKGVLLVDTVHIGTTVSSEAYVDVLQRLESNAARSTRKENRRCLPFT